MNTQVQTLASVQERVRERIQASFVDLIPPELWDEMVRKELGNFTHNMLPELVKKAASEKLLELLKEELNKPEWRERWGSNGQPGVSDMVGKVLREAAPSFVEAWMGNYAQQLVQSIRNGQFRPY